MEQQVWSMLLAKQSTVRPRVAVPPKGGSLRHQVLLPHWGVAELGGLGLTRAL